MDWQKQCEAINTELQETKRMLHAQTARLKAIQDGSTDALVCPTVVTNYVRDMAEYISVWLNTPELMRSVARAVLEDNTTGPIRQKMKHHSPHSWGIKQQVHWDLCVAIRHALQESANTLEEEEQA